eukprot:TRINITY_DN4375_c1_g1_i6.p4 TRINITY_DN4375_c1_g1~~TRINITY_DN4375_c1_g1_i6.p4  ORF type:complete len:112 (-),score=2.16 TRINITY_DN4375_c1_g1_i6:326-661(-)
MTFKRNENLVYPLAKPQKQSNGNETDKKQAKCLPFKKNPPKTFNYHSKKPQEFRQRPEKTCDCKKVATKLTNQAQTRLKQNSARYCRSVTLIKFQVQKIYYQPKYQNFSTP